MFRLVIAVAVGYAAARVLLEHDVPEELPEPVRAPLLAVQGTLRGWRELAREALAAGEVARQQAERDLHAEYLARSHRS
ncbi:MAG: hypothetical protein DWI48_03235 [Chloroflexi bacterium]|nr:MAG: hypothetical protein DWI48_03235 [Chloroflexota bacterium]